MARKVRVPVLFVALGLAATLVSCQDESAEPPENSPEPGASESLPTPSDELPEMPDAASEESEDGALAFGEYYYDLINYGRATDDWEPVQEVTAESCDSCSDFWADNPNRMGNDLSIRTSNTEPFVSIYVESEKKVAFPVSSDKDTKDVNRRPLNQWMDQLEVEFEEGRWEVVDLEIRDMSKPLQSER